MILSTKEKAIIGSLGVLVVAALVLQYTGAPDAPVNTGGSTTGDVTITLLTNAGIMIEAGDTRIYVDPIDLPQTYRDKPADAVMITHEHGDHYQYASINMVQKEGTVNVFPSMMDTEISRHDGTGVAPGEEIMVGDIKVTAYYMYTFSPDGSMAASHPIESGYCSYIVDVDGFTIFHAGDSKNIPEYEAIANTIDVACLPLGPGCQTMCDMEVVDVIDVIHPAYMIPIHYTDDSYSSFNRIYTRQLDARDCTYCSLEEFTSYGFETG